jgi:hypothetical protein
MWASYDKDNNEAPQKIHNNGKYAATITNKDEITEKLQNNIPNL